MKISLNWIKQYLDFELPPADELVTKIAAQLGGVDEVIKLGDRYRGVVIVKVVESKPLEGSDHLNVCLIDDGGITPDVNREADGLLQVVCGAPNVRGGMMVAWLPPGATVPSSFDEAEPFVLSARPLRGVVSNGMLASAKELAIGDSHEGLLELDGEHQPGDDFAKVYALDDVIIDIENKMFTHRPDCFGQLGVAREIAGILGRSFKSPDWYVESPTPGVANTNMRLRVVNEIPELVPRYMLAAVDGIAVGPSPVWLQSYLSRLGVRPINNIVDVTNYLMLLTGQPLHAFDFDKVASDGEARIIVRNPHVDETVSLLDGKTVTPRSDAILICGPEKPIGLGGVMGGNNSEIDAGTKRILIESASFDMFNIRRTSMEHGIFSDAVTRFTKGQSEWQCPAVLYQAIEMIQQLCVDATLAGEIVDQHQPRRQNQAVPVTGGFINDRLGLELSGSDMQTLLQNVEFAVEAAGDDLHVMAPFWRTDIELREDVVEEVGRLYGFDHLPTELPRRDITPAARDAMLELKAAIRSQLSRAGANEVLTYSFVHGNLLDKVGQDRGLAFKLTNALSPDLQYYRLSLTPSLLNKVHPNIKAGYDQFALFELGKVHIHGETDATEETAAKEINSLAFVYAAKKPGAGAAYYQARKYLIDTLSTFGAATRVSFDRLDSADLYKNPWVEQMVTAYDPGRSAVLRDAGGLIWGVVGEFKASVRKQLKLPDTAAGFEIDPLLLLGDSDVDQYVPLPRFPKVRQDITLRVDSDVSYQQLFDAVWLAVRENRPDQTFANLGPLGIYQSEEDPEHKNISLRLSIASYERTLTDTEVSKLLDTVTELVTQQLVAERV